MSELSQEDYERVCKDWIKFASLTKSADGFSEAIKSLTRRTSVNPVFYSRKGETFPILFVDTHRKYERIIDSIRKTSMDLSTANLIVVHNSTNLKLTSIKGVRLLNASQLLTLVSGRNFTSNYRIVEKYDTDVGYPYVGWEDISARALLANIDDHIIVDELFSEDGAVTRQVIRQVI